MPNKKRVMVVSVKFEVEVGKFPPHMATEQDLWVKRCVEEAVSNALELAEKNGYNHSLSTHDDDLLTMERLEVTSGGPTPVIEVSYYKTEPTVKIPPGLNVELKLIDTLEAGTLLMEYEGALIFWAVKENQCSDSYFKSEHWVSTQPGQDLDNGDDVFDVRDLPQVPPKKQTKYAKLFPQEPEMRHEWKRRIAYAIDEGSITDDGYNPVR